MRRLIVSSVVGLLLISIATSAEPPRPVAKDEQDLMFFDAARPLHLRLHLQVDNRSFQAHWDEVVAHLFRFLDFDGNGRLSAKEAEHAPSVNQLRGMMQSKPDVEADEAPRFADLSDDPKHGASIDQLKGYYHRVGVAPWQIDWISRPGVPDHLDDEILKGLGADGHTYLKRADFKNGDKLIHRYDGDRDEIVSAIELNSMGYSGGFAGAAALKPDVGPFFIIEPSDKGRSLLAAAILKQYDRNKDGRLTNAEVTMPNFNEIDRNRDGSLAGEELAAWPLKSPDLDLLLRLDGPSGESLHVLPSPLKASAKAARIGAVQLHLRDDLVEVYRMETLQNRQERLANMAMGSFDTLDQNKDGVLDSREASQPPFEMVAFLRLADRDGDGKLGRKEFGDFLDVQKKVITRSIIITLLDRGRSLFDFLDADHDHRLSRRELMSGFDRLSPWADVTAGEIERGRIPRQYQILVSHGPLPRFDSDPGVVGAGRPETRLRGPTWFRKMDRNADGDVSVAEFLGTAEQFKKLDLDGDGLIGLPEAEAAGPPKK